MSTYGSQNHGGGHGGFIVVHSELVSMAYNAKEHLRSRMAAMTMLFRYGSFV